MRRGFSYLWRRWKSVLVKIGHFQAAVFFSFSYFVLLALPALALRWFADPLAVKKSSPARWIARAEEEPTLEQARRQF